MLCKSGQLHQTVSLGVDLPNSAVRDNQLYSYKHHAYYWIFYFVDIDAVDNNCDLTHHFALIIQLRDCLKNTVVISRS